MPVSMRIEIEDSEKDNFVSYGLFACAAAREHGLSYSRFIAGLKRSA